MDKRLLQTYSVWAKDNLEKQIEVSLKTLGIKGDKDIAKSKVVGEVTVIEGDSKSYPKELNYNRQRIIDLITSNGYENTIEQFAYTWFNRFIALRYMEVHDFLPHGFRVLSDRNGGVEPEILKNLTFVKDELKLDMVLCSDLKEKGKTEELYRYVLFRQCRALAGILPMLFDTDSDCMELLLPQTLLKGETVLTRLLEIPEENFLNDVEIIGWMYQFYISVKKDEVFASKKTITKDTLPAVTQLFTPDWIVRYMAENSVGRIWLESYPKSNIKGQMKYYVEDAGQTEEVQRKIDAIKYKNVNPEDIKIIEPCCGSGHILVYVFDLLYLMYDEKGYSSREIPTLILKNNLTGLDVDKRAAQLAAFSLVMKARSVNPRFFSETYYTVPKVYEIKESKYLIRRNYKTALSELGFLSDDEIKDIEKVVNYFKDGKTIGSLLKISGLNFERIDASIEKIEKNAVVNIFNSDIINEGMILLKQLVMLAKALSAKYDVMITNPPYISISSMEDPVKEYAYANYPNSKTDMFAMFMEAALVKNAGFISMINMHNWMFLSSFEDMRKALLESKQIVNMLHLGPRGFDSIGGEVVQTTSFVLRNFYAENLRGQYYRLTEFSSETEKKNAFIEKKNSYQILQDDFNIISGSPCSYWISDAFRKVFLTGKPLTAYADTFLGIITGDNEKFLRLWSELDFSKTALHESNINSINLQKQYWIPYNKGGEFRRWYGIQDYLINWKNGPDDKRRGKKDYRTYYLREYVAWSYTVSSSTSVIATRYYPQGFLWDVRGSGVFDKTSNLYYLMALISSKVGYSLFRLKSEALSCQVENIAEIPVIVDLNRRAKIDSTVKQCIEYSRSDWDSNEFSWDFAKHPLFEKANLLSIAFEKWQLLCEKRFNQLKANEEELNRVFIDIYGLQGELSPEVEDKDVTVHLADKEQDIKSLISYFVGIVMGRYSLDVEGLAYAGGEWDSTKYRTYQPDEDGIVPIYEKIGMEDSLTARIIELIKLVYGEDTYRQNIDFIAEALGKNSNESAEETLNRYLNDGFYADHLKVYQKRPIYWMFSSGKNSGFKCLIYMHRYNKDTLAAINGKYFLPESARLKQELDELLSRIEGAEGRERIRLEKERQKLAAAYNEAIEYGQVLDHMANKYIEIELDDGVKVNYAKFQAVEMVNDSGTKVKKDLLVPIK